MGRQRATEQQQANRQLDKDWKFSYAAASKKGKSGKKGKKKGY